MHMIIVYTRETKFVRLMTSFIETAELADPG